MEDTYTPRRTSSSQFLPWLLLGLVVVGFVSYFAWERVLSRSETPKNTPAVVPTAAPVQTLTAPGVLRRIQQQSKLETVSFKITTVVTATKGGTWWKLKQDAQKAIYIVDGTITAGIDLSKLSARDVTVSQDGKLVSIQMPPAEIFDTNLKQIQTYDEQTGLAGFVNPDPKLMEQAQQDARVRLGTTACESDILKVATENGKQEVERLFSMIDDVNVTVVPAATPSCTTALATE